MSSRSPLFRKGHGTGGRFARVFYSLLLVIAVTLCILSVISNPRVFSTSASFSKWSAGRLIDLKRGSELILKLSRFLSGGEELSPATVSQWIQQSSANVSSSAPSPSPPLVSSCDLYDGKWVLDPDNYPLYNHNSCSFIEKGFNCQGNGKSRREYEEYKWQPNGCDLPRFNAHALLSALRDKRILFTGDSIMRQMYTSMVCLLVVGPSSEGGTREAREIKRRKIQKGGWNYQFVFPAYNASVDFVWTTHIVEAHRADKSRLKEYVENLRNGTTLVDLNTLDNWNSYCKSHRVHVLVLSSGPWWCDFMRTHYFHRSFLEDLEGVWEVKSPLDSFRAMLTNLEQKFASSESCQDDTSKFFLGMPYVHFFRGLLQYKYEDLNDPAWDRQGSCNWVTKPLTDPALLPPVDPRATLIESIFRGSPHVKVLSISEMVRRRADAHVGVLRSKAPLNLTFGDHITKFRPQDCGHFCIPGVPDTWNELLYAHLLEQGTIIDPPPHPTPPSPLEPITQSQAEAPTPNSG